MSSINWKTNQPIIHHLREILPEVFPVLLTPGHGRASSGVGGYVNRTMRNSNKMSDHSEGRAADIFLNAFDLRERKIGDALNGMFIRHAIELGVDYTFWNLRLWSREKGGPRLYPSKPHQDHVHVSFTRTGSQQKPARLRELVLGARMAAVQAIRSEVASGVQSKDPMLDDMLQLIRAQTAAGSPKLVKKNRKKGLGKLTF